MLYITGNILEIEQRQHATPLIAVEDDQVELIEFLLEQLACWEGDQRELIDGGAVLLFRWPQDCEMNEVDRGIRLQHVAPGALARVRFARDEEHAQILADTLDRQHRAVVDRGEFAGRRLSLDLDDVRSGMVDGDGNVHLLADEHALDGRGIALM
jgi:hypothetical protein